MTTDKPIKMEKLMVDMGNTMDVVRSAPETTGTESCTQFAIHFYSYESGRIRYAHSVLEFFGASPKTAARVHEYHKTANG